MKRPAPPPLFLALAIAAALLAGGGWLRERRIRLSSEQALSLAHARLTQAETQLAASQAEVAARETQLTALDSGLGAAKTRLTASEARNVQLGRELVAAKAALAAQRDTERALHATVAGLQRALSEAPSAGLSSDDAAAYDKVIAELERQLALAHGGTVMLPASATSTAAFAVSAPRAAAVVSVGPDNAFVVLNYGARRGASAGQTLAIHRGTDLVARVLISDVRPHFSIAQVRPDSLRGALQKGDSAVLTN